MSTDPTAAAVQAALTVCEQVAAALPNEPIRIATSRSVHADTRQHVPPRGGVVTLHVDTLGVLVIAEIKGNPRPVRSTSYQYPLGDDEQPIVELVKSRPFAAHVGAAVQSALLVLRQTAGAR